MNNTNMDTEPVSASIGASSLRRSCGRLLTALGIPLILYFFFGMYLGWGIYLGTIFVSMLGIFMALLGQVLIRTNYRLLSGSFAALKQLTALCIAIFMISFVLVEGTIVKYALTRDTAESHYLIVLGAALKGDKPTLDLKERLDAAAEYLKSNPNTIAIVSGGRGKDEIMAESQVMKNYLMDKGISGNRIIQEDQSSDTYENIKFSKELINSIDGREKISVTIVSNGFHMFRAKHLAQEQGLEVYGYPAKTPLYIAPSHYAREYFAVVKSFISTRS